jgi:hypothetical protein
MSSRGHSPPVTYTPNYYQNARFSPISTSFSQSIPLRQPPTVYLGQQVHNHPSQQSQAYDHLKREHGSISSASTDSSRQTTPHPRAGPLHIYSATLSMSSEAEEGSLETPRQSRAYPNQYTRPSRSEMAEINAAYQQSLEADDSSENSEDHAIRILVS